MRRQDAFDEVLGLFGRALATVVGTPQGGQRSIASVTGIAAAPAGPAGPVQVPVEPGLSQPSVADRTEVIGLMRVNHVGEVCAQALYEGQAFATPNPALRDAFLAAAAEETDHLAWTAMRLEELGGRVSYLNPVWYAGSFLLGVLASRSGDRASLGFMAETERQVEQHLEGHLARLPANDQRSRDILLAMKADEVAHAERARAAGGAPLPQPVRQAMRLASRVMTTTAKYI